MRYRQNGACQKHQGVCPGAAGLSGGCYKDRYRVSKIPLRREKPILQKKKATENGVWRHIFQCAVVAEKSYLFAFYRMRP